MMGGASIRAIDILAVDDDPEIGGLLRAFFDEHGSVCHTASNATRGGARRAPSVDQLASAV